ncbi:MAG: DUF2283 domain-containing protein [Phycisphaerales bacterium]|nr:DUF2283 domain-containing protein [Phycisphaerales bacterium]
MHLPYITYEPRIDAAHIYLADPAPGIVTLSIQAISQEVLLDLDAEGRLVGIEVLSARERLRPELLASADPKT